MLDKKLIPIAGLKREPFSGCHGGMRYYFQMDESKETFTVTIFPEPWSFDRTPEENKETNSFPMSDEGMDSAMQWLHEMYERKLDYWEDSLKNSMHIVYQTKSP